MNVIAQNIANAQTTRGADGRPYQRQMVAFEAYHDGKAGRDEPMNVRVSGVEADQTRGRMVHDPGHPDANAEGMVQMPNVEVSREMVDLISASRAYEANLKVVQASRQMADATLAISRNG